MATRGLPVWPFTATEPEALPAAERLLLDAARAWGVARRAGRPPEAALRLLLATESATAAAPALDALLRALAAGHPQPVGCPLCPRLVGAEPAMLLAVVLAQRGARHQALACLLKRLPNPAAYAALAAAIPLGCAFRRAGLIFADPWASVRQA